MKKAKDQLLYALLVAVCLGSLYVTVASVWVSFDDPQLTQTEVFLKVIGLGD